MDNESLVTPVEEQVTVSNVADVVAEDDCDTGHKVIFYVILGLIGLSGVGIPVLIFLLVKEHKKRKQLEDISFLREKTGLEGLSEELIETALLREKYPEATLAELVMYNGETVGKSGINHRLKKLCILAEKLRDDARK